MPEIEIRKIDEKLFTPVFSENGGIPKVPSDALLEYDRLIKEWLMKYPHREGIEPRLNLHPVKIGGVTRYALTQELMVFSSGSTLL